MKIITNSLEFGLLLHNECDDGVVITITFTMTNSIQSPISSKELSRSTIQLFAGIYDSSFVEY